MIFKNTDPSPIFGCKDVDVKFHPDPVECFVDLSEPVPAGVEAGTRFIVQNVSSPDASWTNLPDGLEENDIIERDFQDQNWLLATDVSSIGAGILVYVDCRGYYYWFNGTDWCEINPSKRFEKIVEAGEQEILDSLDVTNFNAVQWNVAISYLDGSRRRFQSVFATHEDGTDPSHNVGNITGSKKNFFDYEIEVSITSGVLNLVIINDSPSDDYKIQVRRIPIENFNN